MEWISHNFGLACLRHLITLAMLIWKCTVAAITHWRQVPRRYRGRNESHAWMLASDNGVHCCCSCFL
jgi:hypothetical protein